MTGTRGHVHAPALAGAATLAVGDYDLAADEGVFVDVPLWVDLPAAGLYAVDWDVRATLCATIAPTINRWVMARVVVKPSNAVVPGSQRFVTQLQFALPPGEQLQRCLNQTSPVSLLFTAAGPTRLQLQGALFGAVGAVDTAAIASAGVGGMTAVRWARL